MRVKLEFDKALGLPDEFSRVWFTFNPLCHRIIADCEQAIREYFGLEDIPFALELEGYRLLNDLFLDDFLVNNCVIRVYRLQQSVPVSPTVDNAKKRQRDSLSPSVFITPHKAAKLSLSHHYPQQVTISPFIISDHPKPRPKTSSTKKMPSLPNYNSSDYSSSFSSSSSSSSSRLSSSSSSSSSLSSSSDTSTTSTSSTSSSSDVPKVHFRHASKDTSLTTSSDSSSTSSSDSVSSEAEEITTTEMPTTSTNTAISFFPESTSKLNKRRRQANKSAQTKANNDYVQSISRVYVNLLEDVNPNPLHDYDALPPVSLADLTVGQIVAWRLFCLSPLKTPGSTPWQERQLVSVSPEALTFRSHNLNEYLASWWLDDDGEKVCTVRDWLKENPDENPLDVTIPLDYSELTDLRLVHAGV